MRKKIALFLGVLLLLVGAKGINTLRARYLNDIEQEWLVQDAHKRIANYEWYFDQYEAIKATALKVKMLEGKEEQEATKMVLLDMVASYNSRSRQTTTRAQWKATALPYQVDIEDLGVE